MAGSAIKPVNARFGRVDLTDEERQLYHFLNDELLGLCRELPGPLQFDASIFLIQYSSSRPEEFDFFKFYYAPAWSILHWMTAGLEFRDTAEFRSGAGAHALAMFLHSIDDHLLDGQQRVNMTILQLRTKAWSIFEERARKLAAPDGNRESSGIVSELIDEYADAVHGSGAIRDFESYCANFRGEMAIWYVIPMVFAEALGADESQLKKIRAMYEAFMLAWRWLDDLQDLEKDARRGDKTCIYWLLGEEGQSMWSRAADASAAEASPSDASRLWAHIESAGIVNDLLERIPMALSEAHESAMELGWEKLGRQYLALSSGLAGGET